jgi:phage terminase large subunit-like protein
MISITPEAIRRGNVAVDRTRLRAGIARDSFYDFVREFWDVVIQEPPVFNWHIPYLCNELQECCERVVRREKKKHDLIVNISPGTTKSTIFSVMLGPWLWTKMPECRIIGGSYTQELALNLGRMSRDIVDSDKYRAYYPHLSLRADQNTKTYFMNAAGGWRLSRSVGSAVTGFHAHVIIVDDPLDPKGARSEEEIKNANEWMTETLPSRKVNKEVAFTALVMQRLHQNDPTGHQLTKNPKGHKWVCLPAEETQHIRPKILAERYTNGLFDPVRLSREVLDAAKKELGEFGYAGQFLQTPVPLSGGMFKTDCFLAGPSPVVGRSATVRYWDKAGTRDGGAYTVGVKMTKWLNPQLKQNLYGVRHVARFQLEAASREKQILQTAIMDGKDVVVAVEQEPGSSGKEAAEATARMLAEHGFRCSMDKPTGDKTARADVYATAVNSRSVYVDPGEWNGAYFDELQYFPDSTYKDQTDASSGAFKVLTQRKAHRGAF